MFDATEEFGELSDVLRRLEAAEERAEKAERENRELRGVVEANGAALLQAESLCNRIEAEGGHGQRVHEMAKEFLSISTAPPYQCPDCADLKSRTAAIRSLLDRELGDTDPIIDDDMTDEDVADEYPVFRAMQIASGGDFTCPGCEEKGKELERDFELLPMWLRELWKIAPNYARQAEGAIAEKDKQIADYRIRIEQSIREGGSLLSQIAERDARLAEVKVAVDDIEKHTGLTRRYPAMFGGLVRILSNVKPALAVFDAEICPGCFSDVSRCDCSDESDSVRATIVVLPHSTREETK